MQVQFCVGPHLQQHVILLCTDIKGQSHKHVRAHFGLKTSALQVKKDHKRLLPQKYRIISWAFPTHGYAVKGGS